jgi:2-C-methyl-D-erythritol 4-phosphate cytidylyltransferase
LRTLIKNKNINKTVVVINPKYKKEFLKWIPKNVLICDGGKERQDSLVAGIKFLKQHYNLSAHDIIITHDCARINISQDIINQNITITKKCGFASTVFPISDSLCEVADTSRYITRDNKYLVQTPQTFQYRFWKNKSTKNTTDLFTYLNLKFKKENLVIGCRKNFKITTKADLN